MKAVSLVLEIEKAFNIEFPVGEIYRSRTIRQQAHLVNHQQTKTMDGVVLLRRGEEQGKTIFFVHGGSGSIGGYVNMFHVSTISLDERFTTYGIRYDRMNTCAPIEEKIENLAADYLNRIKQVQNSGVYNLAAWCIGAQIITEIAFLLETEGLEIGKLIFFNSIAPREWQDVEAISLEKEKIFASRLMDCSEERSLEKCRSIDEVWDLVSAYSKKNPEGVLSRIPKDWLESIPNFRALELPEILYYLNCMRSLAAARATYKPKGKVRAQCVFINPKEDKTIPAHLKAENIKAWSSYFDRPIIVVDVRGNEYSIFDEDIDDTIRALNSVLGIVEE